MLIEHFHQLSRLSRYEQILVEIVVLERVTLSAKFVLAHVWQIIHERGGVMSCEPFKFWWASTISLERLKLQSSNFVHM